MRRNAQVLLLLLLGAGLLHISLVTDFYLRYVKAGLQPLLIASGAVLLALGLVAAYQDGFPFGGREKERPGAASPQSAEDSDGHASGDSHGHAHGHSHGHSHPPRVSYLLFLPALALLLHLPPALGSFTAARESETPAASDKPPQRAKKKDDAPLFSPLPASRPAPLTLTEFLMRADRDRGRTLKDRTVRMTGFVTPGRPGAPWELTRIVISCCAADSQSLKVRMAGMPAPPADSWVTVTGTWQPPAGDGQTSRPTLRPTQLEPVSDPPNPYMDSAPQ
ncbi:TIGR03943 family putative permease subunit [Streptomyces nanshensis]|uniref:DUF1980 domain-containing protein n=1 Tax=Streptomyces nanshensis TaxID=518642 RepID=A0A1E7LAY1_9ACTN|nr:TIGR03943 family protein [Streptomyces nanshensis]OEV13133.1 hypothetical protein AN218_05075 [Streptomyces nanshensis]